MNIILIQPFTDNLEPPLSLAFLAAALERGGHKTQIIDLQISHIQQNWEKTIDMESVDLVGITAMTPQIKQAHEIAKNIKNNYQTCR
jgi:magnesium-protoporphyrin IX monomethyl ester (oxidative) cyclase